jgi:transcriptional regulator with XRE-family HTH domain
MLLSISETIKNRRKELNITQSYLADMAEVSVNTIFKIERGEANPTVEVVEKIIDVLGMEIQLVIKDINRL